MRGVIGGMRHAAALITIALVLIAAPAASAKEITKVRACGSDGCVTTRDHDVIQALTNGGPPTVPPRTDGPVIRLRATVTEPGHGAVAHFVSWWVPSEHLLVAEDGTWMPIGGAPSRALDRLTTGLTPFPAAEELGLSTPAPTPAAAPPASDDGGFDWLLVALPGAALALAAALLVLLRRRPHGDLPVKHGV
jgi:hypothetical protein